MHMTAAGILVVKKKNTLWLSIVYETGFVLKHHVKITDVNSVVNVDSFGDKIKNKDVSSFNCDDWVKAHAVPTHDEDNALCVTDSAFVLQ